MLKLIAARDGESTPVYGLPFTDAGHTVLTLAGVEVSLGVPEGTRYALIAGSDHYFVSYTTMVLPAPGVFSAQNVEQDKQIVYYPGGAGPSQSLFFITRNSTDITVSFWR
jgi:hypothetical protein